MTIVERYDTVLRCYDNGGRSADRYTIVPPRWAKDYTKADGRTPWLFEAIGCSAMPFYPQGIGMLVMAAPGPHLGRRIKWGNLPHDVQVLARDVFPEYAPKEVT